MASCMKSIAIRSPNNSPATLVNLLMIEQAPHIASTNRINEVQTQTLHMFDYINTFSLVDILRDLTMKQEESLPSRPSQEQVASQFRSSFGKVEHECVHDHSWLCNSEYQQWLASDNRVNDSANGCRCQCLNSRKNSICKHTLNL